jgi:hypothetical protein
MATLKVVMKKHNINIDSTSSSHEHALSTSGFSFNSNSTTTSSSDEWLIDSRASYHMAKDKAIFSALNECNTKKIFVGDDRSLSVVGSGTVQVDNGHFNDVLCVPSLYCNLLSVYQITHSDEGKTVEFSPHQVVIKDLKYPKHVLATGIADDITRLYKFDNFGSSSFSSVFVSHSDDLRKLWHEQFGHLNYRSLQQLCNQQMVVFLLFHAEMVFVSVVFSTNIIRIFLTNVPLGMPRALYILFTVICVVHFLLLPFMGASIS